MTEPPEPDAHMDAHQIAGYIEGTLDPEARAGAERHLADCEECTSELAAVSRLRPRARRPARWLGLTAAAAAAIAIVVVGPRLGRQAPDTTPPERGDPAAAAATALVAPAEGVTLRESPVFVWRAVPGAATYRISVTRADGDSVWSAAVRDTTARAPEGTLVPGTDVYYWYVDALVADGRSVAGPTHQFRLGP